MPHINLMALIIQPGTLLTVYHDNHGDADDTEYSMMMMTKSQPDYIN